MTNMASIGTLISLVVMSLFLEAKSKTEFVKVACKFNVVGHYGTDTILDCVVETQKHITDLKILVVTWNFNGKNLLVFHEGSIKNQKPGFQFAEASWDNTNMNVSLRITKTNLSHAGEYTCFVLTDSGDGESKVQLSVQADYIKPKISSFPKKIKKNEAFNLTCESYGGYPKGELRWLVDNQTWKGKPEENVTKREDGLFDLSSKLTLKSDSKYSEFVCEVYNASGAKVAEEKFYRETDGETGGRGGPEDPSIPPTISPGIVAPIVVIGSLIVGLLLVILLWKRKRNRSGRQEVPDNDYDDEDPPPCIRKQSTVN